MSLDVYLTAATPTIAPHGGSGIFVRRDGATVEISRDEWNRAFPDQEPVVFNDDGDNGCQVYSGNITHNLNKMAERAGIYQYLWRPDELGIKLAKELIAPLAVGLLYLRNSPDTFKPLNPSNGWGSYEGLVKFVADYLAACREHPDATVRVSR